MWARAGGERQCQSRRLQEAVVQGSESGHATLRCAPQRDFWMPGAPPNPWPACWGTLTGLRSASAPPLFQAACPQRHFQKWPWLVLQPRRGVQGTITSARGMRSGWAPRQVPSGGLDHALGAGGTPAQAVCLGKKRPSSSCHYGTERQTERRALRESEFLAISWPTWPSPLTFWSLSYFICETGTATSSLIIIQNCCED